jgi:cytidine deaminase
VTKLTCEENEFIERVKPLLKSFLKMCEEKGIEPGAGSYVLSESSNIYHGVPFSAARVIHGEENAIGTMVTEEGINSKLKIILIVGSPEEPIMPCGMCRVAIYRYGIKDTAVLCANQSLSKIEKYTISELYPHAYQDWEP